MLVSRSELLLGISFHCYIDVFTDEPDDADERVRVIIIITQLGSRVVLPNPSLRALRAYLGVYFISGSTVINRLPLFR